MNVNELARHIADLEGKKQPVSIAQVKEVVRIMAEVFSYNKEAAHSFVEYVERKAKAADRATAKAMKKKARKIETSLTKRLKK